MLANGPFSPAQTGHLDDTGFPTEQDMEEAKRLIAEYKAENPGAAQHLPRRRRRTRRT